MSLADESQFQGIESLLVDYRAWRDFGDSERSAFSRLASTPGLSVVFLARPQEVSELAAQKDLWSDRNCSYLTLPLHLGRLTEALLRRTPVLEKVAPTPTPLASVEERGHFWLRTMKSTERLLR